MNMINKCITFGIKKLATRSLQSKHSPLISQTLVPAVKQGEYFKYLGGYYDFALFTLFS